MKTAQLNCHFYYSKFSPGISTTILFSLTRKTTVKKTVSFVNFAGGSCADTVSLRF